jgi:hypothetical protein
MLACRSSGFVNALAQGPLHQQMHMVAIRAMSTSRVKANFNVRARMMYNTVPYMRCILILKFFHSVVCSTTVLVFKSAVETEAMVVHPSHAHYLVSVAPTVVTVVVVEMYI